MQRKGHTTTAPLSLFVLVFGLIFLLLVVSPASAHTVTISDLGLVDAQEIYIYNSSSGFNSVEAVVNSSGGTVSLDANYSYMFVIRPTAVKSWMSPQGLLDNTINFINAYGFQVIVICFLGALILRGRK